MSNWVCVEAWPAERFGVEDEYLHPMKSYARCDIDVKSAGDFFDKVKYAISKINIPPYWAGRDIHIRAQHPSKEPYGNDITEASSDVTDKKYHETRLAEMQGKIVWLRYNIPAAPGIGGFDEPHICDVTLYYTGTHYVVFQSCERWTCSFGDAFLDKNRALERFNEIVKKVRMVDSVWGMKLKSGVFVESVSVSEDGEVSLNFQSGGSSYSYKLDCFPD